MTAPVDSGSGATGVDEPTDDQLVVRAAGGDHDAFAALVGRHHAGAWRVAARITGRSHDADDATQAAWIAVWRHLVDFRGEAQFTTWLHRIVTNCAFTQLRLRAHRDRDLDLATLAEDDQPCTATTTSESVAFRVDLRAAVGGLPAVVRRTWYARDVEGMSYQDVAILIRVDRDVVRGRISRARRRLARELADWR